MRPHRWQPTRLPCPWDSPGKNTGVGCPFLLQFMKVKSESEVAQSCLTQWLHGLQPTRLLCPWDFPGKSTGVGCHCLLCLRPLLLLLLLSHFSRVRLSATPSLGFSKQEHWSGLPFPSPMHKSEKWKWIHSVMSDSSRPHGLQSTRLLRPWDFPGKSTGVGCHCLLCLRPLGFL